MNDSSVERMLQDRPLIKSSLYTQIQAETLRRTAGQLDLFSSNWDSGTIENATEYYDMFLLWILGAYEVLRTMDRHNDCFSPELAKATNELKKKVAEIRMPFAKQELRSSEKSIRGENSFTDILDGMTFRIRGKEYASAQVIREVISHFDSIQVQDVVSGISIGDQD